MYTTQDIFESITAQRIVTEQRGSWRWQDAYRVATYQARGCTDGVVRWQSVDHSPKYSRPQLRDLGIRLRSGSLHNRPISRDDAVAAVGRAKVAWLESRGYRFHVPEQQAA